MPGFAQEPGSSPAPLISERDANGNPLPEPGSAEEQQEAAAERVVITGSHISVTEVFEAVPQSLINVDAIKRTGTGSFGDIARALPQNSGPTFTENQSDSLAPGAAAIALRGLTPDATLVLLNGRRVAPYPFAQGGITSFVDLNSFPLAAVEQIDIVRDGASAVYGSDAIAGVVNVRLFEKYQGTLISTGYGNTTDSDAGEFRASVLTGYTDPQNRHAIVFAADYFHRNALFQSDRYFSESIDQRRQGGRSFLSSVANPGTVFDPVTGDPLRVPADSDGTPEISEFTPGRNRFDRAPFQPLVPETERFGFFTRGKFRVAEAVDVFAELGYRRILTTQQLAPAPIEGDVEGIAVPADNPFNPFGDEVVFRYRVTEAGPRIDRITSDNYRALVGMNLRLPSEWLGEAALLYSETATEDRTLNNLSRARGRGRPGRHQPGHGIQRLWRWQQREQPRHHRPPARHHHPRRRIPSFRGGRTRHRQSLQDHGRRRRRRFRRRIPFRGTLRPIRSAFTPGRCD